MNVVGIDIGAARHVAAVCREGKNQAERPVLRTSSRRAGFDELDGWMARQGQVGLVVMESSGHYWMPLASHLRRQGEPVAVVNPLAAKDCAKGRPERLKTLAERTVAPAELEHQVGFELALLIDQYDLLEGQIAQAEDRVASLLDGDVARRLQSIPGVGPATAAALMAEIGDISRFTD